MRAVPDREFGGVRKAASQRENSVKIKGSLLCNNTIKMSALFLEVDPGHLNERREVKMLRCLTKENCPPKHVI